MNETASISSAIPLWFWVASTFLISACVGSFLNVVAARIPRGQSIVWPGSHCFTCGSDIAAHRNIPVLSWFILGGRCHDCRARFSVRYALVELGFALLCAFTIFRHGGPTHQALTECLFYGFAFPLACIDLDTWTLPHCLTIPGILVGLCLAIPLGKSAVLIHAAATIGGFIVLYVGARLGTAILQKEAMGGGDFMFFALIGAFFGPKILLPVIFLASLQGALVGLSVMALRRWKKRGSAMDEAEASKGEVEVDGVSEVAESEPNDSSSEVEGASVEESAEATGTDDDLDFRVLSSPSTNPADVAAAEAILNLGHDDFQKVKAFSCKVPGDGWTPDAHSIPFGPFLALAAVEAVVFDHIGRAFFPWM